MNDEQMELARRLVALPGWRWCDGMASIDTSVRPASPRRVKPGSFPGWGAWVPDLTDAATAGALLSMLEDARGTVAWSAGWSSYPRHHWSVEVFTEASGEGSGQGATLGEAVAWALLAVLA